MQSLLLLFLVLLVVCGVDGLSANYVHGPIKISNEGRLWYTGDAEAGEVHIALQLALQSSASPMWVGLGLAAPGSAGMRGAALYSAQFASTGKDCTVQARAAPFIGTSRLGLPADSVAPPLLNNSDNHSGWRHRACSRYANGTLHVEVTRALNSTADAGAAVTSFLHAYGPGAAVSYHSDTKFSTALNFFRAPAARPPPFASDYSNTFSLKSPELPNAGALTCYTGVFSPPTPAKMVIAMEAVLKPGAPDVARLMVYGCAKSEDFFSDINSLQAQCKARRYSSGTEAGARCGTLYYSWAPGMGRLTFPEEAGIHLNAANRQILVEVTFNSTITTVGRGYKPGDIELRFHYSDKGRRFRVGTLAAGDAAHRWAAKEAHNVTVTCGEQCTRRFKEPLKVFAAHMHLGLYGSDTQLWAQRAARNWAFESLASIPYWAPRLERYTPTLRNTGPVSLNPGDRLTLTCGYNLDRAIVPKDSLGGFLEFGRAVETEQCNAWLHYYPAQYADTESEGGLYYCAQTTNDAGRPAMICGAGWRSDVVDFQNPACFPAHAAVSLKGNKMKYMKDLSVGDEVLVAPGTYSRVHMFTHADASAREVFVVLRFSDGRTLAASPGHLLYSSGSKLVRADEVIVGDELNAPAESLKVAGISREVRVGLYNPQTLHGDIVVDGVVASTYTSAMEPSFGHALLSPTRLMYSFFTSDASSLVCGEVNRAFLLRIRQLATAILSTLGKYQMV